MIPREDLPSRDNTHPTTAAMVIALEDEALDAETMGRVLSELRGRELDRYEKYRRSRLTPKQLSIIIKEAIGDVPEEAAIAVGSLAKLYVGDLVGRALEKRRGLPIRPEDYLAAARDLDLNDEAFVPTTPRQLNGPPIITRDELL